MKWMRLLLSLALLGIGIRPVFATILYAGGEDADFTCTGTCAIDTNNTSYRPAWARESYTVGGTATDPPSDRFATAAFTGSSTLWVHARYCQNSGAGCPGQTTTVANDQMIRVFDNLGNPALIVRGTGTSAQLKISSRTSAGAFTDLVTCAGAFNTSLTQLDLAISYGTSGSVTLYNNSAQVCTFSGNVTNGDGGTTLTKVEFAAPEGAGVNMWSEIIVADGDTRAMSRYSLVPAAAGTNNNWSTQGGTACTTILPAAAFNDANYIYEASNNVVQECTVTNAIPAGSYNALALVMNTRILVGASGPQHFDFVTGVGGTDYPSGDVAPTNSFSNIGNYIQTTNPATSAAWSVSDWTQANFNVGLESKP